MSKAVGVLIVDEPNGLEPSFRATLEHTPALYTICERDLQESRLDPGTGIVALIFARETHIETACKQIARVRGGRPSLRILVSFRALNNADLRRLIVAGAHGFIGRDALPSEVCTAILALAGGHVLLVDGLGKRGSIEAPDGLGITPREAEVLRFLSAGFSNKEVARRLSLSVRTVETHRLNLRRKTQTGRLKDLVSLARQLGLDPVLDTQTKDLSMRHRWLHRH